MLFSEIMLLRIILDINLCPYIFKMLKQYLYVHMYATQIMQNNYKIIYFEFFVKHTKIFAVFARQEKNAK